MRSFIAALLASYASAVIKIEDRVFVDEQGRQKIFHGVNVVYKVDPYIPSQGEFDSELSLNDEDIANLTAWGMNFVRLGVMWEAVEREPSIYDTKYLDDVVDLVNKLGENGIYTLIDAHQDVLARVMCGEGMPDFYAKQIIDKHPHCISEKVDSLLHEHYFSRKQCFDMEDYGFRRDENGDYLIEDCQTVNFGEFYGSRQSWSVFHALYNNEDGLQDKFMNSWDAVTAKFAGNQYVLGYDPLNEPAVGSLQKNPLQQFWPGYFDKHQLTPMYERANAIYQKHDSNSIMWFEPGFPDIRGKARPVGFTEPPGGEYGSPNHVLNDHTYCCQLGYTCPDGDPDVQYEADCLAWHQQRIYQRSWDAQRLGIPFFNTEFGACLTEDNCSMEIRLATEVTDDVLSGWAYWEFKTYADLTTSAGTGSEGFYNKDGSLQDYKVKALSRSYLMETQGRLTYLHFSADNGDFVATYTCDTSIAYPSRAYFNKKDWYGDAKPNFRLTHQGKDLSDDDIEFDYSEDRYFTFRVTNDLYNGEEVTVTLSR